MGWVVAYGTGGWYRYPGLGGGLWHGGLVQLPWAGWWLTARGAEELLLLLLLLLPDPPGDAGPSPVRRKRACPWHDCSRGCAPGPAAHRGQSLRRQLSRQLRVQQLTEAKA